MDKTSDLEKLISIVPAMVCIATTDGYFKYLNPEWEKVLGYSLEELFSRPLFDFIHPDDHEPTQIEIERQLKGNMTVNFENRYRCKDGSYKVLEWRATSAEGDKLFVVARDITERKKLDETIHHSQKMFARTESLAHIGSWEWEIATDTVTWSEELFRIFQLDPDDGAPSWAEHPKLYHPEDFETLRQAVEVAVNNGTPYDFELRVFRKDGETRVCQAMGFAELGKNGKPVRLFGSLHDITERKQVEEALQISRNMLQTVMDSIPSAVFWKDCDLNYLGGNRPWLEAAGLKSTEEVIGKNDYDLPWEKEQADSFRENDRKVMESGIPEYNIVEPFLRADGSQAWAKTNKVPLRDKDGKIIGVLGTYEDITERKRTEEERNKLQAQLSNALEMAHLGHWEYDVSNDLFTFNDHFYKIFRTTANQVGGYTMNSAEYARRFAHPDDLFVVGEETRKAIETTDPNFKRRLEHRIIYADGSVGYISVWFFIVKDAHGRTVKIYRVNQDITDRKRAEEELLRVEKLESVGVLAGGIAHDFNNILTAIIGNISLAKDHVAPEDEIYDLLNEAVMASTRARMLTKQLLTFAKGGAPVKEIASIEDVLKESTSFVLRGSKSKYEISIADDLWLAEMDPGQISQVINNIVINANHAMPNGGTIQFAADNVIIEDRNGFPVKPGRYIRISIADQGTGIAQKQLINIFDPYFTTKQEGSGLGLATTYSIIKKHDGHITVESQLGVGTTFHIYLPASDKVIPEKEKVKLIKGQGRILVMDDEASLRKMVRRMLQKLGYEAEFAKDGDEAIRMVREAQESEKPFDAVILDLTIPGGMGGKETVKKLLEINPEVKAIVSSGYSGDPVLANFQDYGFKGMLPKPFESRSLGKVLHEVLKGEKE